MSDNTTPASKSWGSWIEYISGLFARRVVVVSYGDGALTKDREKDNIGNTMDSFSWPEKNRPTRIRLRLKNGVDGTSVRVLLNDPLTPAIASGWLLDSGTNSTPRKYRTVHNISTADANTPAEAGWTKWIFFSSPFKKLYFLGSAAGAGMLEVEAE